MSQLYPGPGGLFLPVDSLQLSRAAAERHAQLGTTRVLRDESVSRPNRLLASLQRVSLGAGHRSVRPRRTDGHRPVGS